MESQADHTYAKKCTPEMMATAIKRPGSSTIPPAAKKHRFDIKGGVRHFDCKPASQIENAIQKAQEQEGVVLLSETRISRVSFRFCSKTRRFQKCIDCFDDENWTLKQIKGLLDKSVGVSLGSLPPSDLLQSLGLH